MSKAHVYLLVMAILLVAFLISCTTGVEPSPASGTVRVTLKASEVDTAIIILGDTSRFSRWDAFNLFISQGRVYQGQNYSPLYVNTSLDRISSDTVNVIAREWLDGTPITIIDTTAITPRNSKYRKYVLFEWVVPPGSYDRLQFALTANEMSTFIPKIYQNPVFLPADTSPVLDFPISFSVNENGTTQIDIEIYPFKSVHRYRDSYVFDRKLEVVGIQNQ
jgi:hypothetical protein